MSRLIHSILLICIIFSAISPATAFASPEGQTITPDSPEVRNILASLSPEEKVGQLFIVTFDGRDTGAGSAIHSLVTDYHVGGVVLLAANDNFTDVDSFAEDTLALTSALQLLSSQQPSIGDGTPTPAAPSSFIPLFIAAPYSEDGAGSSLLRGPSGLTQLPSSMTIGATWNPDHAQTVGRITGAELSALGINMLFGPTLDVIESPQPDSPADLGARAFGGDPYWVGKMGRAFIDGVHEGSQNRIAVVAQHFPGYGASDRASDEQIPTVSKTLDELQAIDLAPFFTVVAPGDEGVTDALLVSHIRYRGLQGNIRDTTRPISLDPSAMGILLGLPQLAPWRANGGITVSDALGVRALRRFYDPTEKTFQAFNIARDAFLAGNDVLYLGQFATPGGTDQTEMMETVISQFLLKYNEDPAFAQLVDQAAARIIAQKLRLYGNFTLRAVAPSFRLDVLGIGANDVLSITRDAATLISPSSAAELANRLPNRPNITQKIVFITDARMGQQCTTCATRPILAVDALQQAVLRFYGPQGTSETFSSQLSSFSFNDLINFLNTAPQTATATPEADVNATETPVEPVASPTLAPTALDVALDNADWVVISMLDVRESIPTSLAVKRLLSERPDLLQNKRVIVFAFGAPYYLDATEVAQLTAYYGLYNRSPNAVDVAARILFQEIAPTGASPVSIDAVGYRLIEATQPNPNQVISLTYELSSSSVATATPTIDPIMTATASPTAAAAPVTLNDVINLRTSVIVDRNGHPVPDGTPVRFWANYLGQGGLKVLIAQITTIDGIATTPFPLDRPGQIEVSVTSEPAIGEQFKLQFTVSTEASTPEAITSTPGPATNTVVPTETATLAPTLAVTPSPTPPPPPPPPPVTPIDLFMAVLTLGVMGTVAWRVTNSRFEAVSDGIKLVLAIAIGAFLAYNYYALKLPGTDIVRALDFWAVPFMVWLGGGIGFGLGWWWLRRRVQQ
jgi:beta-N-acetylhexosaminidase